MSGRLFLGIERTKTNPQTPKLIHTIPIIQVICHNLKGEFNTTNLWRF